jgi:hypothetical protein
VTIPRGGRCSAPTSASVTDAQAAYDKWKADLVTSDGANGGLRVIRPNSAGGEVNSTVSGALARFEAETGERSAERELGLALSADHER